MVNDLLNSGLGIVVFLAAVLAVIAAYFLIMAGAWHLKDEGKTKAARVFGKVLFYIVVGPWVLLFVVVVLGMILGLLGIPVGFLGVIIAFFMDLFGNLGNFG